MNTIESLTAIQNAFVIIGQHLPSLIDEIGALNDRATTAESKVSAFAALASTITISEPEPAAKVAASTTHAKARVKKSITEGDQNEKAILKALEEADKFVSLAELYDSATAHGFDLGRVSLRNRLFEAPNKSATMIARHPIEMTNNPPTFRLNGTKAAAAASAPKRRRRRTTRKVK